MLYYSDGNILQLDKDVTYGTMPREGLECVEVYRSGELVFQLYLDEGKKLIYRRRVQLRPGQEKPFAFYILGWRTDTTQSINFIYEDALLIQQLPKFKDDIVQFSSVQLYEFEK